MLNPFINCEAFRAGRAIGPTRDRGHNMARTKRGRGPAFDLAALASTPGAKVLRIDLDGIGPDAPEVIGAAVEPGAMICSGTVPGRAVPWKSPTLSRTGGVARTRDYLNYESWKATVAGAARLAMGRKRPYGGPVRLEVAFYLQHRGSTPDTSNLVKGFEDSLQAIVYQDDCQVVAIQSERILTSTEEQRVEWAVHAASGPIPATRKR